MFAPKTVKLSPGIRPMFQGAIALGILLTAQFSAAQAPLVFPGQTIKFADPFAERVVPDDIGGFVERFPPVGVNAVIGADTIPLHEDVLPLSGFTQSRVRLSRGLTHVFQYNDFTVEAGDGSETVVPAQVSGTINVKGYMLLIGIGSVREIIGIDLIDITDDPNDLTQVVASETFRQYELSPDPSISLGMSIEGVLGSATAVQVGADVSLGLGVPITKKVVRENFSFAFDALLRRGHTYRLVFSSQGRVRLGPNAGLGIVSFWSPLALTPPLPGDNTVVSVPPSLIDPQTWLTNLDIPLLDRQLPALDRPGSEDTFKFADFGWWSDIDDTNDLLRELGLPTNVRGIVNRFFSSIIPDEEVQQAGVDLRQLDVTIGQDQVELLNMISDQVEELKQILLRHPPFTNGPNTIPPGHVQEGGRATR